MNTPIYDQLIEESSIFNPIDVDKTIDLYLTEVEDKIESFLRWYRKRLLEVYPPAAQNILRLREITNVRNRNDYILL